MIPVSVKLVYTCDTGFSEVDMYSGVSSSNALLCKYSFIEIYPVWN